VLKYMYGTCSAQYFASVDIFLAVETVKNIASHSKRLSIGE